MSKSVNNLILIFTEFWKEEEYDFSLAAFISQILFFVQDQIGLWKCLTWMLARVSGIYRMPTVVLYTLYAKMKWVKYNYDLIKLAFIKNPDTIERKKLTCSSGIKPGISDLLDQYLLKNRHHEVTSQYPRSWVTQPYLMGWNLENLFSYIVCFIISQSD